MVNSVRINELLNAFSSATRKDWEKAASKEINDNLPDEKLSWQGPENLTFLPYYNDSNSDNSLLKRFQLTPSTEKATAPRSWLNQPLVTCKNEKDANEKIRKHLESGADGIFLRFAAKQFDFKSLFDSVNLTANHFSIYMSNDDDFADHLADFMCSHRKGSSQVHGKIFSDLLPDFCERLLRNFSEQKNFFAAGLFVAPDENPINEIKTALVKSVRLIDQLTDKGFSAEDVIDKISFSLEAGTNFYYTIAKLKALRFLWFQIARAYKHNSYLHSSLHIHVRSEVFSKEAFNPHANMLKGTLSSLAAVAGGCDGLTVFPEEENNEMMERIARNVSIVLRDESHMQRVADPTAGAWLLDKLTYDFAASAWTKFQQEIK